MVASDRMDISRIPQQVVKLLKTLVNAGYQAYIVGGAVRDMIMGHEPLDYDIATSALPDEILAVASASGWRVIDKLGHNFGVVMMVIDHKMLEVATFRGEKYGSDSHRPQQVWFTQDIETDLARRDFTINAMAVSIEGDLIDLYGGRRDIEQRIIRTVGRAEERFREDGLRMFRACRFSGQLGFAIEAQSIKAISVNLDRVNGLSLERVRSELEKMLLAQFCNFAFHALVISGLVNACCRVRENGRDQTVAILPELLHLVNLPQNPRYHHYDGWEHTLAAFRLVAPNLALRWGTLLHDVGKGMPGVRGVNKDGQPSDHGHDSTGAAMAEEILSRLRVSPVLRRRVVWLVARHMRFHYLCNVNQQAALNWMREEARSGLFKTKAELCEAVGQLAELCFADARASNTTEEVIGKTALFGRYLAQVAETMPVRTRDVAYEADELLDITGEAKMMGRFLKVALGRIQDGNLVNERQSVLTAARKWVERNTAGKEVKIKGTSNIRHVASMVLHKNGKGNDK